MAQRRSIAVSGFTIMEMMVVLAIVGLLMTASVIGLRNIMRSDLRSAAGRIAASMRYVFDRATMTGTYMRMALDLDAGRVWLEYSEDKLSLRTGRSQLVRGMGELSAEELAEQEAREKEEQEKKKSVSLPFLGTLGGEDEESEEGGGGEYEEGEGEMMGGGIDIERMTREWKQDMQPVERRASVFKPLKNMISKTIKLARGIQIISVTTPRLKESTEEGKAYVYFFPQGHSEPAIIHLADSADDFYSVVLHPLTGRAKVYPCLYRIPDDFGVSDDKRSHSKASICHKESEL